jgi:serine/threonine-protein kinase
MELLEGHDLNLHATLKDRLPVTKVLEIVAAVAEGLDYAHGKGVVHRDVKPANIMLLDNGLAKLADFGVARAMASSKTKTGVIKGTPFYMSPEQIMGKKVDGRSDIFSLGVVLYELLTGRQPFRADDLSSLIYKITKEDPEPASDIIPEVPKVVDKIIAKALTKERDQRYQMAGQLAAHLKKVLQKMGETARTAGRPPRPPAA